MVPVFRKDTLGLGSLSANWHLYHYYSNVIWPHTRFSHLDEIIAGILATLQPTPYPITIALGLPRNKL